MKKANRELRGEPCIEIEEVTPAKKQIISSRSFGQPVTNIADLQDAIAHFITNAALKLRQQNSIADLLQVFIMTDRFRDDRPQYNPSVSLPLPLSTNDTITLNRWACKGLETIYKAGYQYKKAGVILGEISHQSAFQTDMFESAPVTPELMLTMDSLNSRFGKGTVRISQDGSRRAWTMRQDRKSPDYTTNWNEMAQCQ